MAIPIFLQYLKTNREYLVAELFLSGMKNERRLIFILAAIQFTHILDFVIMMPLGPQLMRAFEVDAKGFAFLVSSYTFASAIFGFIGASVIDRFERKSALLFAYLGFAVGTFFCSQANGYDSLLLARIFAGCFGGLINGLVFTIIGDVVPEERRGKATGSVMAAFSIASVVGVPIGLYFAEVWDWHAPFLALVIFSQCVAIAVFFWIPKMNSHMVDSNDGKKTFSESKKEFIQVLKDSNHQKAFSLTVCMLMAGFTIIPFLSTYLVYNVGIKESDLPLVYLCGGGLTFFSSRFIGRLSDNKGRYPVFFGVAVLSIAPILVVTNLPEVPLLAALVITTFFMVLVSGRFVPAMALITSSAIPHKRGTFMGVNNAVHHLSSGVASIVGGALIVTHSDQRLTGFDKAGYLAVGFTLISLVLARRIKIRK